MWAAGAGPPSCAGNEDCGAGAPRDEGLEVWRAKALHGSASLLGHISCGACLFGAPHLSGQGVPGSPGPAGLSAQAHGGRWREPRVRLLPRRGGPAESPVILLRA